MDPEPGAPPDIQTALLALVNDPHSSGSQPLHVPLLVQRRCAAVQRSIDVLRVFRTLRHAVEETSSLVSAPTPLKLAAVLSRGPCDFSGALLAERRQHQTGIIQCFTDIA